MAFLPTSLSGLAAWYDASDAATVTGIDPVTQWGDKSGNARHLTHATLGPAYVPASQLMRFDGPASNAGSGDYLNLPPVTMRTVFAFIKAINPQTATNRYHALFGSNANDVALYLDIPGTTTASYGIRPKGGLHKVALNGEEWISQTATDATVTRPLATNGALIEVEYASGVTTNSYMGSSGFNGSASNWRPNWDLAEVIVYDRVLTADEKDQIEGYLAHKWSRADLLPSGHPYKSAAPGGLDPANALHGHSASSPGITTGGAVAVESALHGHAASAPALTGSGLTLTDVTDHRIFQRTGTAANIPMSGTYSGTAPTGIEARVLQGASPVTGWTALAAQAIAGGNWSGTLANVPQGGMYRIEVRSRSDGGGVLATVAGANQWGVGDIYGVIGSSSAERWFTIGEGYSPDAKLKVYDGSWKAAGTIGAAAATFGNQIVADSGVPVALLDLGIGGSTIAEWSNSASVNYAAFRDAMTAAGGIRAVIAVVGMNDARAGGIASQAGHEGRWRTLIANIRSDAESAALPVLIWGAQRCTQAGMDDQQFGWMRAAELAVGTDANVHLAATTIDLPLIGDGLHLTEAGMAAAAGRVGRAAGALFYGTGAKWRGPVIESVRRIDDTHSDVTITHQGGTDFTPASGITGFVLSTNDFATMLGLTGAAREASNVIRLSHAPTGGAAARVRYQYGAAPDVSGAVNDNNILPLPLLPTGQALSVLTGDFLIPEACLHGTTGTAPMLDAVLPAAWLLPGDASHAVSGQDVTLFSGQIPLGRQVLRIRAETRRLAVGRD